MGLDLHPACRSRLVEKLADEVPTLKVMNGMFLDYATTSGLSKLDKILPESSAFQNRINRIVSDEPVSDFVADRLAEQLDQTQQYDADLKRQPLVELEEFQNAAGVASELVDEFESLPWSYACFVRLPFELSESFRPALNSTAFELSDQLSLVEPDDDHSFRFPDPPNHSSGKSLWGLGDLSNPVEWSQKCLYVRGDVSGYIGFYANTAPLENFNLLVRALCGFGLATRLFRIRGVHYGTPRETKIVVFRKAGRRWSAQKNHSFSEEFSHNFESLDLGDILADYDEQTQKYLIRSELQNFALVFREPKRNESLIRAGQWLFDSYCGKNELLGFVQATVALEILLGDKATSDLIGLGELLRNRCAYLIGRTRTQRDEVLSDFDRIYNTRSKIVHRGKNRLTSSERDDLWTLRWMCSRVIQEEVKLIVEEAKAT